MVINEGAWKKTTQQKQRRSYATGRPLRSKTETFKKNIPLLASKKIQEDTENSDGEPNTFDPISRDPFFLIPRDSKYWQPSAETIQRLRNTTAKMPTYNRVGTSSITSPTQLPGENKRGENDTKPSKVEKPKRMIKKQGHIQPPRGMDVSKRRRELESSDDENTKEVAEV